MVEAKIFPAILPGFDDPHPYIRELTLKSMLTLAPKLKPQTLTGPVLRALSKLQVDAEPGETWQTP